MAKENEYELEGTLNKDMSITLVGANALRRVFNHLVEEKLLIKISKFYSKRSEKQNRYFWGVIIPIVKSWLKETQGIKYTPDEVYYWLNSVVLGNKPEVKEILGQEVIVMVGKRFSQMTTKEFAEAVDKILEHFAELGCNIPEPNQENFITDHITDN